MDIEAFKRYCLKSFDKDYLEKLNGKQPITIFDYLDDKLVVDCQEEYTRFSKNVQSNEDTIEKIREIDFVLGGDGEQPASLAEARVIGLLRSLGYEMGDDLQNYI